MADDQLFEIGGLPELLEALERTPEDVMPFLRAAMIDSVLLLQGAVKEYPPASSGNQPGGPGSRWYERGYGPRWKTSDGTVRGRKLSERLRERWSNQVRDYPQGNQQAGMTGGFVEGTVGNKASYRFEVQSREKQLDFHRRRGWVTVEDALDAHEQAILDNFTRAADQWIAQFHQEG